MSSPETAKPKKALFIGLIATTVVAILAVIATVFFLAKSPEDPTITDTTNDSSVIDAALVPSISTINLVKVEGEATANMVVQLKKPLPADYTTEYEIRDANKKTVSQGIVDKNSGLVTQELTLTSTDTSFTFRVRISNADSYSEWVTSEPQLLDASSLPESDGINTEAKPDPSYFDTAWAKGEGGDANFEEAMKAAWGITRADYATSCGSISTEQVRPGIMIPPTPSLVPEGYFLSYDYQPIDGTDTEDFAYYWCSITGE